MHRTTMQRTALTLIFIGILLGPSPRQAAARGGGEIEDPEITLELPLVTALPGEAVSVPVAVTTDSGLSMAAFSVQYPRVGFHVDAAALSLEVEAILAANPDADSSFLWYQGETEGAGWVQAAVVVDYRAREEIVIPPGSTPVARLTLRVSDDAQPGDYPITFVRPESAEFDGHFEDSYGGHVYNSARRDGGEFEVEDEFEDAEDVQLRDGVITVSPIIGDVGIFVRGDANVDRVMDISDPVRILEWLFLGGEPLSCEDAADANDDGTIDLSDPVNLLGYLFEGLASSTITFPAMTRDATPDALDCASY